MVLLLILMEAFSAKEVVVEIITEDDVIKVIQEALELSGHELSIDSVADDIPAWDSLGHLSILSSLDKNFDGKCASIKGLATVDSIKGIIQLLKDNALM
jgi:acyl carrier protein